MTVPTLLKERAKTRKQIEGAISGLKRTEQILEKQLQRVQGDQSINIPVVARGGGFSKVLLWDSQLMEAGMWESYPGWTPATIATLTRHETEKEIEDGFGCVESCPIAHKQGGRVSVSVIQWNGHNMEHLPAGKKSPDDGLVEVSVSCGARFFEAKCAEENFLKNAGEDESFRSLHPWGQIRRREKAVEKEVADLPCSKKSDLIVKLHRGH